VLFSARFRLVPTETDRIFCGACRPDGQVDDVSRLHGNANRESVSAPTVIEFATRTVRQDAVLSVGRRT